MRLMKSLTFFLLWGKNIFKFFQRGMVVLKIAQFKRSELSVRHLFFDIVANGSCGNITDKA